jgi:hypothetical protein
MGTVMSYCHLRSGIGINLAYGFGPLPQEAIRNTVNNAGCLLLDNIWTGAIDTAWENAGNWSCGSIPTNNTDVTIPGRLNNFPVITGSAVCRRLKEKYQSSVIVMPGAIFNIEGKE